MLHVICRMQRETLNMEQEIKQYLIYYIQTMDQKTSRDTNTTMMALAALMFFSPFVHYVMSK